MQEVSHIVNFSGGKDSTAMLIRMLEENMRVDEIIFCKVMATKKLEQNCQKCMNILRRLENILN